ncbi:hypothetical protein BGZ94_004472 [Podila epigama]|nr:hypothetical protein BGZ94_004472 [Podila epigama]
MWSFDLVTLTWTQIIPSVEKEVVRYGHSCDIVGANLIIYGGRKSGSKGQQDTSYGGDIQVFDVVQSAWMSTYSPKQDTTEVSKPHDSGSGNGGLSLGAIIGIVVGAVVVLACVIGAFVYKRRQKQIEIREAELEKEAYLASLRPEGDGNNKSNTHSPHYSPARTAAAMTPGMGHEGPYQGMDQLLTAGAGSPAMGGQGQNVQYLMQHLPDGTIAVQPVYLDHQPLQIQPSPNMMVAEANGSGGYVSPPLPGATVGAGAGSSSGYFVPPPTSSNLPMSPSASTAAASYVLPPTPAAHKQTSAPYHPPPSQDPFASPSMGHAHHMGSPQQGHPEAR